MLSHLNSGCQSASRELPQFSKWTDKWGKQKVLCNKFAVVFFKVQQSSITDSVRRLTWHAASLQGVPLFTSSYIDRAAGVDIPLMFLSPSLSFCFRFWIHLTSKVQICFSARGTQLAMVSLWFGSAPRLPPLTCLLSSTMFSRVWGRLHSCDGQELQRLHKTLAAFHALGWARIG